MITFFFIPGHESEKDSDIFDTDRIFGIPHDIIQQAMVQSVDRRKSAFLDKMEWKITNEEDVPNHVNPQYVVTLEHGEIVSHDIFTSL